MATEHEVTSGGPVLALFAHPDDTEFTCGGTLALWAVAGRRLVYGFCTDGSKGSGDADITGERLVAMRQGEQRAAARALGCDTCEFLPYEDALLEPTIALRRDLTRLVRRHTPETVVCFDPAFYYADGYVQHPDHRASGEAALAAVFPAARDRLTFPELLTEGLEPHNVKEVWLVSPLAANRWIDIGATIDRKIAAMAMHESQMGGGMDIGGFLRERARAEGMAQGLAYAESFRVISFAF